MIRNLTTLGAALTAAIAICALAASAASAQQGVITSDGPFYLVGTDLAEGSSFTYPGLPATACPGSHAKIGRVGANPIEPIPNGSSVVTNIGTLTTNCKVGIFPMTVKTTSCDFRYFLGETTGEASDTYGVSGTMECATPGDSIHAEIYSDAGHTNRICMITFDEQTPTSNLHATDTTDGSVRVHGSVSGVHATKSGGGCGGPGTTNEAVFHINVEGTGENEEEEPTAISLSH